MDVYEVLAYVLVFLVAMVLVLPLLIWNQRSQRKRFNKALDEAIDQVRKQRGEQ